MKNKIPNNNPLFFLALWLCAILVLSAIVGFSSIAGALFPAQKQVQPVDVLLDVPAYKQNLNFSCNLEAARMALAYRGIHKSILDLYVEIAHDTTLYNEANNTYGDPNVGYVGDINGNPKGYGVYWQPIADLINKYRPATVKTNWNLPSLLKEVQNNNPVIIWSHNTAEGSGARFTWKTPQGETINAVTGMHSYVVVGFNGTTENPTEIALNDSNRGRWVISKARFLELWTYFNNTAVVVY